MERAPTASEPATPAPPPRGPSKLSDGAPAPDLEGLLGRGSYGVVWRGRDHVHGPVAVKIVPTDGSGGSDGGNGDADGELADEIDLFASDSEDGDSPGGVVPSLTLPPPPSPSLTDDEEEIDVPPDNRFAGYYQYKSPLRPRADGMKWWEKPT